MVCSGGPLLIKSWMQQIAHLRLDFGIEVIWVTSGAIATGADRADFKKPSAKRKLDEKQALSALGQPLVMENYLLALQSVGLMGAQILLTSDDLKNASRRKNFQATVNRLLDWKVTPVLNENDAIATEEIRFGDNDNLSASVAVASGAERLVILTDVDGLFDRDPRKHSGAHLIAELHGVPEALMKKVIPTGGTSVGTGGMYTKLQAAKLAGRNGVETWLARGDRPAVLIDVAHNHTVGTRVLPVTRKGGA